MFQSIEYIKYLRVDKKTKLHSYEFELTDSDFGCVKVVVGVEATIEVEIAAVIQEYSKRNLNVAKNLFLYFRWYEKKYDIWIASQIKVAEKCHPLFTPQIKADIEKYLLLL
jgi:hypothetical protein